MPLRHDRPRDINNSCNKRFFSNTYGFRIIFKKNEAASAEVANNTKTHSPLAAHITFITHKQKSDKHFKIPTTFYSQNLNPFTIHWCTKYE